MPLAIQGQQPAPISPGVEQSARNQIRTLEGRPFRRSIVNDDLTRLNRLGRFRTIRADAQIQQDGSVIVTFTLQEQQVIQDVQTVGNRELTDQELLNATNVFAGAPIDRFNIDRGARAIEDLYRAKGFYRVRVEIVEKTLEDSAIVLYRIVEGDRVRVTDIRFEGNQSFTAAELRGSVQTKIYFPIIERGPLDDNVLARDVSELQLFYRDRGYLDARTSVRVTPSPDGREAIVTFLVDEGPLYTIRSVRVLYTTREALNQFREQAPPTPPGTPETTYLTAEQMRALGRHAFSSEQISGIMTIKPGDAYSETGVRLSQDAIRAAYSKLGYVRDGFREPTSVNVDVREVRDENAPLIDLILFLDEGKPFFTGNVEVAGNSVTKQQVILRQVQVQPDRPLDLTAVAETQRRLNNARLFQPASVRVRPQQPRADDPSKRDLLIEVQETNTGKFEIGAAIGSDAGIVGRVAVNETNFDIANPPDSISELLSGQAFRGAGQVFNIELLPGTESQTYSISLTEPAFLETDYSLGSALYYRTREYDQYDEERIGNRTAFGRRFGTVWSGNLVMRQDLVSLSDIDDDAPTDFFDVQDQNRVDSIGIEMVRNTSDDRFRPSRGSRVSLTLEQVGLTGGDFDFTRANIDYSVFLPLYDSFEGYKTVLRLESRLGYIVQGQDAAPTYERYYMGGRDFRGFAFRGVSPVGEQRNGQPSDEAVGGAFRFFLGAEVQQPIYQDILSVVGFVDSGTVAEDPGLDDYRISVGFGIRLNIQALSPVPIAFDFGFPIMLNEEIDRERVFSFAIDLPY